jgi:hypothetical protein
MIFVQVFEKVDKDGGGTLDKDELRECFRMMGVSLSDMALRCVKSLALWAFLPFSLSQFITTLLYAAHSYLKPVKTLQMASSFKSSSTLSTLYILQSLRKQFRLSAMFHKWLNISMNEKMYRSPLQSTI